MESNLLEGKLYKGKYFKAEDVEKILSGACDILSSIGVRVVNERALKKLEELGFEIKAGRVVINQKQTRSFLTDIRARLTRQEVPEIQKGKSTFDGMVSIYSYNYERPEDGQILPFDTSALTSMAQFVEKCSQRYGFGTGVPGYPCDVPPALESLIKYKIAAENCHDGWPLEPTSMLAAKYMFEMAEIMEKPMRRLPVFIASPLCLGGDSFDIVFEYKEKLESVYVFSMPTLGVTTPLSVSMAFAMDLAEVLGGALLVHELTGLPVDIKPNVFPFDLRAFNIGFGSPEKFIFECMSADFSAQLLQTPLEYRSTNIHTWAKKAGIQAAVEKGTLMMAGAMNGARKFYSIGTLSLDEVFSPIQLILDLEIMQHVAKLIKGFEVEELPENFTSIIKEGLERGFISSDLTLDCHEDYIWYSKLFERTSFNKWANSSKKDVTEIIREEVKKINQQDVKYILDAQKARALNEIYKLAMGKTI
ncbi:MAG TPA: trimethylamine methyltransferase family protein [Ruminiclostridium sp.]